MKRVFVFISLVFILLLTIGVLAQIDVVSIEPKTSTIYDSTPKVKLQVSGFEGKSSQSIVLEIGVPGQSLQHNVDYTVTYDDTDDGPDSLIVALLPNKRCA
jgi:hypothetical protein